MMALTAVNAQQMDNSAMKTTTPTELTPIQKTLKYQELNKAMRDL